MKIKAIAISSSILVAGCTSTLDTTSTALSEAGGVVYALPYKQYEFKITRTLKSCKDGQIQVGSSVEINPRLIEDPAYVIKFDPLSLSEPLNSISMDVEFHEGTRFLKSVNAEVKDDVGPTLVSAIKLIGTLAGISTGTGAGVAPAPSGCSKAADAALTAYKQKLEDVSAATAAVTDQTQLVSLRFTATKTVSDGAVETAEIEREISELRTLMQTLEREKKALQELASKITVEQEVVWPPADGRSGLALASLIDVDVIKAWTSDPPEKRQGETDNEYAQRLRTSWLAEDKHRALQAAYALFVDMIPESHGRSGTDLNTQPADISNGAIYFRQPEMGAVRILGFSKAQRASLISAVSSANLTECPTPSSDDIVHITRKAFEPASKTTECWGLSARPETMISNLRDRIPQLGYVQGLPVSADRFQSLKFSATFAADGGLLKTGYTETSSQSSAAIPVLEAFGGQYAAARSEKDGEELSALQEQKTLLETKVAIETANKSLNPDEPTELELVTAELALLKAKIELESLQSDD